MNRLSPTSLLEILIIILVRKITQDLLRSEVHQKNRRDGGWFRQNPAFRLTRQRTSNIITFAEQRQARR